MDDSTEVERLRARVQELEGQLPNTGTPSPAAPERHRSRWYAVGSVVLLTIACILAPLSATAVWASTQVSDTEQYVQTVAPLADDPAVQAAVANDITNAVIEALDVEAFTREALTTLSEQENVPPRVAAALPGLAVPIANGVESFTRTQVTRLVQSPQFAELWERVNTVAHEQLVTLLEGNEGGAVSAQGDTVTLNLAPIIEQVKARLVAEGFTLAERIPTVDRSFVLVQSEAVTNAQTTYRVLNTLGVWLPVIALALFAAGVFLARDRRRAVFRGALGVVGAMLLFGVALAVARIAYIEAVPPDVLSEEAAGNVFDTLVRFLRSGLRTTAVLGLLVALAAWLSGPGKAATRTRETLRHGIGSARSGAEAAGWRAGRFGPWVLAHTRALRAGTFLAAGLVLLFWERPTVMVVVVTALLVGVALVLIEFLGTPPPPPSAGAEPPEGVSAPEAVPVGGGLARQGTTEGGASTTPTQELPVGGDRVGPQPPS
jgi:hypothetical protein